MTIDGSECPIELHTGPDTEPAYVCWGLPGLMQFHRVGETCILPLSLETPFRELKSEVAVIYDLLISHRGVLKGPSPVPGFMLGVGSGSLAHSTDPPLAVGISFRP